MNNKKFLVVFVAVALIVPLLALPAAGLPTAYGQSEVQATVRPVELNVRQTPVPEGAKLGVYPHNTVLRVMGREDVNGDTGIWVYTTPVDGGMTGWVRSDYLEFAPGTSVFDVPIMDGSAAVVSAPGSNDAPPAAAQAPAPGQPTATTTGGINFRTGPSTATSIIRMLPTRTTVALTGRNATGTWVQASVDGQTGWLYAPLLRFSVDRGSLPVVTEPESAGGAPPAIQAGVVPAIGGTARQIFLRGLRMGNRRDVFSKVGDSITFAPEFLTPIGVGGLQLQDYGYLQPVVSYFSRTMAATNNSFANTSQAARGGWASGDLLDPARVFTNDCQPGESPLVCEYRITRPAVALIMVGTNDIRFEVSSDAYRANLQRIVQTSIDMGVIPVLSTIPDNYANPAYGARVFEFNDIIVSVANQYGIPLWNYWMALQGLPGHGVSGDGYHPSVPPTGETAVFSADGLQYGYTMRNLTALMVLDAVRKGALY